MENSCASFIKVTS